MADLGAIGVHRRNHFAKALDVWAATNAVAIKCPRVGGSVTQGLTWWAYKFHPGGSRTAELSGVALKAGLPVPDAIVRLYYRVTGGIIAATRTAGDGTFLFGGLDAADTSNYYAVALDPANTENALVLDRLTAA